jgi:uncharacterized protein YbjT (DUF2867 family)
VPELLAAGFRVRILARHPSRLADRPWVGEVEVLGGDVTDSAALTRALAGVDVAYYLVHSLGGGADFEARDRTMAERFGAAARQERVARIVYLGGLAPADEELSTHLRSRVEVGEILLRSGVPTAVLRAAVILGSGSASFEMLRYLTERLPAMVTPRWVDSLIQPVAIRDVLRYLVGCADLPPDVSRSFDIAGPDVLTYRQMMRRYAAIAGLRPRLIVPVPVLTPRLSSHWVGLVTPVPSVIAKPLVESLRNTVVAADRDIVAYVPDPPDGLLGFDDAVALALQRVRDAQVATRWSSASVPGAPSDPLPTDPDWTGGSLYEDRREATVQAPVDLVWEVLEGIGGDNGWYSFPLAWRARGLVDRLVGGVGLRRGRRDPHRVFVGEAVDFWRVEARTAPSLLRLRAEMRLPGLAWLEFRLAPHPHREGWSTYSQRAVFHPRGLLGHLYWWSVAPFHGVVFGSMARNITRTAENRSVHSG